MSTEEVKLKAVLDANLKTRMHIAAVAYRIRLVINALLERAAHHDDSKMVAPEAETFAAYTPRLKNVTYGSDEYKQLLREMKPALDHHYAVNRHHPEYFKGGVNEMTLIDLIEMLCDWSAATKRHDDGDIIKSIEKNKIRFGLSDQLERILMNTVQELGLDK